MRAGDSRSGRPETHKNDSAVDRLLRRADEQVTLGRLWRAKEILSGGIREFAVDVRLLEAYGRLLHQLGDRVEAGKFLFLSGVRGPDVDSSIALFVSRHGKGHISNVVAQFPARVRSLGVDQLPPVVKADLEALGLPDSPSPTRQLQEVAQPPGWRQSVAAIGCSAVGLLLLVACLVGLVVIGGWLLDLTGR